MRNVGIRTIEGVNILPLDGLWHHLDSVPPESKISAALSYAGCDFHDEEMRLVTGHTVSLAGIGGVPVARETDSEEEIRDKLHDNVDGSRFLMGSSAAFSYLNRGEKSIDDLYTSVTKLGHFSIAHAVQVNLVLAGISEGAELELSLQRDLIHISKLTNARTVVQNRPPIVVPDGVDPTLIQSLYTHTSEVASSLRQTGDADSLEYANGLFPVNKATILMISGDLSNLRKVAALREDAGKEKELRAVATSIFELLNTIWPEIITNKGDKMEEFKGEQLMSGNDYFADRLIRKLDYTDPIFAAYEAQAVSRDVGFDFQDFQDVVPRALDEIRETKEAFTEEGPEGREHFGDEIADIMFSLINLARHAGIDELPTVEQASTEVDTVVMTDDETIALIDHIGTEITRVSEEAVESPDQLSEIMKDLLTHGLSDAIRLALAHEFNPEDLLRENVSKYLVRCQAIETLAAKDGKVWADLAANNEIGDYWKKAKSLLK